MGVGRAGGRVVDRPRHAAAFLTGSSRWPTTSPSSPSSRGPRAEATGWSADPRPGPGHPTGRLGAANVASIQRLLGPTLEKVEARRADAALPGLPAWFPRPLASASRSIGGSSSAWCWPGCRRGSSVSYDLLVTDEGAEDQDLVYYVGPNVVALEIALRVPLAPVPALAGSPRGDPPQPVHRRAMAARSTSSPWSTRDSNRWGPNPRRLAQSLPPGGRRGAGRAEPAQ